MKSKAFSYGVAVSLLTIISGCSNPRELTRDKVADLIEHYPSLKSQSRTALFAEELYMTGFNKLSAQLPVVAGLQGQGLLSTTPVKNRGTYVILNKKGLEAAKQWKRDPYGTDQMANNAGMALAFTGVADEYGAVRTWDIPIGSPEFTEVTGIHKTSETTAQVQFSYKFKPNDLGQKMLAAAPADKLYGESTWEQQLGGTAQLTLFDDGWRVSSMPNL